jgi:hypothetical protein
MPEGRCRCGRIRVGVAGDPGEVIYCHCRDCRRSSGAPVSLFCGYRRDRARVHGEPAVYESSPGVFRAFCVRCGSPISYEDERLPQMVYFPTGIFDEPERFLPRVHEWTSQRLPFFEVADDLPRHAGSCVPR